MSAYSSAASEAPSLGCERCGVLDSSLRLSTFTYTVSLLVVTFKNPVRGVYCLDCRRKEGARCSRLSSIFGWWGFPWGVMWTLDAIARNGDGGIQDPDVNAGLLRTVAAELTTRGDQAGALAALMESLLLREDESALQQLRALHVPDPAFEELLAARRRAELGLRTGSRTAAGVRTALVPAPTCSGSHRKPHASVETSPVEDPDDATFRCPSCGREQRVRG